MLNAANNALNQIYDLDIDRVNKPKRPLPSGTLTMRAGLGLHLGHLRAGLGAGLAGRARAAATSASGSWWSPPCLCWIYSAPPLWTKRRGIWANITIAIPRGVLLKVAGWSTVKTILGVEPWYIGSIFGLFLLGAATTKDFADIEGDRAGGCQTLPILYGVKKAAWIIAPFFVLPFVLIPVGVWQRHPHRQRHAAHGARAGARSSTASTPSTCWCAARRTWPPPRTIPPGRTCTG